VHDAKAFATQRPHIAAGSGVEVNVGHSTGRFAWCPACEAEAFLDLASALHGSLAVQEIDQVCTKDQEWSPFLKSRQAGFDPS